MIAHASDLVLRDGAGDVNLLAATDLPIVGLKAPRRQRVGDRRVLVRLAHDQRESDQSFNEIAYFGGLGTRFCWLTWERLGRLPLTGRTRSLFARVFLRLMLVPVSPVFYTLGALIGASINFIGMILDMLTFSRSTPHRDRNNMSLESSI